ncbi:MAG: AIM24 family protein [Nostoc sp. DedVER02]|uniref:AIM24 family protein n=1 Tax=unclassified Nostoc TaxID=2593658 RepID=UPI002AD54DCB|nr:MULTISPECIES: AIM24 family protein [unclassified Nostoc]MDZ7990503.1 AIM24 family protein [Nostoc sp. DedVER02]MDZ8113861.1 AIM24 family protein [Nostoc sp. DedVER01b]
MASFEIIEKESLRLVKVTLQNETVRTESGAMYYIRGNIQMQSKPPSAGGFLKSLATGENIFRPTYTGTGELYLEPSLAGYHILELDGSEWILDSGAYWASDGTVEVGVERNKFVSGLIGGEGLFQTKVKGRGKVVMVAQGPVEVINLQNDRLVVDGNFAIARTNTVNYRVEKATKSLLGSMTSGEFLVSTFEGTGTVLLAPVPYWKVMMLRQITAALPKTSS